MLIVLSVLAQTSADVTQSNPLLSPAVTWVRILVEMGNTGMLAFILVYLVPLVMRLLKEDRDRTLTVFREVLGEKEVAFYARNSEVVKAIEVQTSRFEQATKELAEQVCRSNTQLIQALTSMHDRR